MVRVVSATWTVTVRPAWARPRAIPGQPHMQGLPGYPDLRGDPGHRPARPHRQHSPIPLLDHGHVDQCQPRPPTPRRPQATWSRKADHDTRQASTGTGQQSSRPCRIEPYLDQERRLRRRRPGVSAGLSLSRGRPAHAGPHTPRRRRSSRLNRQGTRAGAALPSFLALALSRSQSPRQWRPWQAVVHDRDFARPLTRRPLTRDRRLSGKTGRKSHPDHRTAETQGRCRRAGHGLRVRPGSGPQRQIMARRGKSRGKARTNCKFLVLTLI